MSFLQHILTACYKSLYDVAWIARQRTSLRRGVGYLFVFLCLVTCIGVGIALRDIPARITALWQEISMEIGDATFSISQGTLAVTGLSQPYQHEFGQAGGDSMLLYLDTLATSSLSLSDITTSSDRMPAILITSKKIKIYDGTATDPVVEDISAFPAGTLTSAQIGHAVQTILSAKTVVLLFVFLALIITAVLFGTKLLSLFVVSWLVYVVVRADKKAWTYRHIYTVGLYALTVPIVVDALSVLLLGVTLPFVHTILLFVILFGVIYRGGARIEPTPDQSIPPTIPKT